MIDGRLVFIRYSNRSRFGSRYTIHESPYGNGESRYYLLFNQ